MTKFKLVTVLPALCASWMLTGCPDDTSEGNDDNNNDSSSSDESNSDPDTTVSGVTLSTTDSDPSSSSSDTIEPTMTTMDPDSSSSGDPTDATESSSSSADGTSSSGSESGSESSSTDPTAGTESSGTESSGTDPSATTGTLECSDQDLSNSLPVAEDGTNVGAGDDLDPSCSGGNNEDYVFEWTVPSDGTFQFDTFGSDFDTILSVFVDCDGEELACNDDEGDGLQSGFVLDLLEGTTVTIVIDGYDDDGAGAFVLNINEVLPNMGEAWGACADAEIQDACAPGETNCLVDNTETPAFGACTLVCESAADCLAAPATGDAPAICADLGGVSACVLDCSGGETCPDGMECVDTFFCGWPVE